MIGRMRIALYHNLPSGGAKRSLYEAIRRLSCHHRVHSFTPLTANQDFCDYSKYVTASTILPYRLSRRFDRPLGRLNNAIILFDLIRLANMEYKLAQKLDRGEYDVVLVHPSQWTQAPSLLRYLKTPSLYYCHEPLRHLYETPQERRSHPSRWQTFVHSIDPLPTILDKLLGHFDRLATCSATQVATNSHFTATQIARLYGVQALVAYHGVDTDIFHLSGTERDRFVLSVGTLLPHKGFDFILRSLALIPHHRRPPLVIVSNATSIKEKRRLESIASSKRVELTLLSEIETEELVKLYNQCQLVVYAPYHEPFGLVPLEAMACGAPVVAVREGGPAESINHGETGILVERSEREFARAVDNLLRDSIMREQLGYQAIDHVRRFWTWDQAVKRLEQIMLSVAKYPTQDSEPTLS